MASWIDDTICELSDVPPARCNIVRPTPTTTTSSITVTIRYDSFPVELAWRLIYEKNTLEFYQPWGTIQNSEGGKTVSQTFTNLKAGEYWVEFGDRAGDGINNTSFGEGLFTIRSGNGTLLGSTQDIKFQRYIQFKIRVSTTGDQTLAERTTVYDSPSNPTPSSAPSVSVPATPAPTTLVPAPPGPTPAPTTGAPTTPSPTRPTNPVYRYFVDIQYGFGDIYYSYFQNAPRPTEAEITGLARLTDIFYTRIIASLHSIEYSDVDAVANTFFSTSRYVLVTYEVTVSFPSDVQVPSEAQVAEDLTKIETMVDGKDYLTGFVQVAEPMGVFVL